MARIRARSRTSALTRPRIIAGPICGRALAAYGADVMLVNSPNLPNIDNIIDTSRGKLSVFADLDTADGRIALGNCAARMCSCRATGLAPWRRGASVRRTRADPAGHCLCITVGL